jgi:hypothetical protein
MNGSSEHINYTAADIQRYHAGEMTPQERHALEKAALDDPFLADALEGYLHTKTAQSDLALIQSRLKNKTRKEETAVVVSMPVRRFPWLRVAALFVLVAGGAWLAYRFSFAPQKEIATTQAAREEKAVVKTPMTTSPQTGFDTSGTITDSQLNQPSIPDNTVVFAPSIQATSPNAPALNKEEASTLSLQRAATDSSMQNNVAAATDVAAPSAMNHVYTGRQRSDDSASLNEVVVTKKGKDSLQLDVRMKPAADAEKNMEQRAFNARSKAPERKQPVSELLEPEEGWSNFNSYVVQNLEVPSDLKTKPAGTGEVELAFDLNEAGEPVNIKVVRSLCAACDAEAIRLLKEGPKWKKESKKKGKVTIRF